MSTPAHTSDQEPLILPPDYTAEYLAEGAANIVYRLIPPARTPEPSELEEYGEDTPPPTECSPSEDDAFSGILLRLRKALPTTVPAPTSQAHFLTTIQPLLPAKHVIPQRLIQLPAGFTHALNAALLAAESSSPPTRPAKRHGAYVAHDAYGLSVQDMTARPGEAMVEFKPKWLAASPNAPRGSVRCRTCARRAWARGCERMASAPQTQTLSVEHGSLSVLRSAFNISQTSLRSHLGRDGEFCPLDLLARDEATLRRVAACILAGAEGADELIPRLARWLGTQTLLHRLRDLQVELDPRGVLCADVNDIKFLAAMTLRDCAVFVRFPAGEEEELDVRIGDLDLKSALKAEYWRGNERPLVEGGWYEGRDLGAEGEVECALGRLTT